MRVDGQVGFPECQSRFVIILSFFLSYSSFHHTYDDKDNDDDDDDDVYVSTIIR